MYRYGNHSPPRFIGGRSGTDNLIAIKINNNNISTTTQKRKTFAFSFLFRICSKYSLYDCLRHMTHKYKKAHAIFNIRSGSTLRLYMRPPVTATTIAHSIIRRPRLILLATNIKSYPPYVPGGKSPISTSTPIPTHKTFSCVWFI